jgi:enoyl-CoA hydratase
MDTDSATVSIRREDNVLIVTIERSDRRNAVDGATARALFDAFSEFDADSTLAVAVLSGAGSSFCAGADLKALSDGDRERILAPGGTDSLGPMGPTRMKLQKPVIAAIEGYAVAGGLELALWTDLRVASETATLGVFCRRFGVPLIDLGTIRLPRLIGHSRAMDLILTGRAVPADEALQMGLVNRVVPHGTALAAALRLAHEIAAFPQQCLRHDRLSAIEQWDLDADRAIANELAHGIATIESGETQDGARRFSAGTGRHGRFAE